MNDSAGVTLMLGAELSVNRLATRKAYRDAAGRWRWRVVAVNGRIISASTQGYTSRAALVRSMELTTEAFAAPVEWLDAPYVEPTGFLATVKALLRRGGDESQG